MIEPIQWNDPDGRSFPPKPSSPFQAIGFGRNLGLTFHTESLTIVPDEHRLALAALRDFATMPEIIGFETGEGDFPRITIEEPSSRFGGTYYPATVRLRNGWEREGQIKFIEQWPEIAANLMGVHTPESQTEEMLQNLLEAQAHHSLGQDILVTLSPLLLERRSERFIKETNPRTPNEAVKIVSLYLRSRRRYTGYFPYLAHASVNQGLFYWVLACERMPHLWPLLRACELAKMRDLGNGLFTRSKRVLEALDHMGEQFYLMQNRDTIEAELYHFDFLFLQLAGVFDALARIARKVYKIQKPSEYRASFRVIRGDTRSFLDELQKNHANNLHSLVTQPMCQEIMQLVHTLRNTVHGAGLDALPVMSANTEQYPGLISLPQEEGKEVFEIIKRHPPIDTWGFSSQFHRFEPYSFAVRVVGEALPFIDKIASAIEFELLLPSGITIPTATSPWGEQERLWIPVIA